MKKFVCVAIALCTSAAFANINTESIDRSNMPIFSHGNGVEIEAIPVGDYVGSTAISGGTIFSNMESGTGFQAFASATGALGFDDYNTTVTGETDPLVGQSGLGLDEIRFVGGFQTGPGIIFFDFFDFATQTFVDGFGVDLTNAGNFIYTINITNDDVFINDNGILQLTADDGTVGGLPTTAQWFLSDAAPTIGTEDNTFGGAAGPFANISHKFELTYTPEPTSLVLLGLAGLLIRRR